MRSSPLLLRGEGGGEDETGSASFHQQKSFIFTDLPICHHHHYTTRWLVSNERTNGIPYSVRRLLKPVLEHKLPPLFGRASFWEIWLPGSFHLSNHSLHNGKKNPIPPCDTMIPSSRSATFRNALRGAWVRAQWIGKTKWKSSLENQHYRGGRERERLHGRVCVCVSAFAGVSGVPSIDICMHAWARESGMLDMIGIFLHFCSQLFATFVAFRRCFFFVLPNNGNDLKFQQSNLK